jgi:hypothetical protein
VRRADPRFAELFWASVDRTGGDGACWTWNAYRDPKGYGRVMVDGAPRLAHRVAFELTRGPIEAGLLLDHLCRNHPCVNPSHLEPVTHAENLRRGDNHWRSKTHCPAGHPYDQANTVRHRDGARRCRTCITEQRHERERTSEYRAQRDAYNERRRAARRAARQAA